MLRALTGCLMILTAMSLFSGCFEVGVDPPDSDWTPPPMTRGLSWVRNNPMFISGLTVSMGSPPANFVNDYFTNFRASAAHLWETGLPNEMNGWLGAGHPNFRFVSWVRPDGTSPINGRLIGGYPANAAGRIGYQIGDEPRTMQEFLAYDTGFRAIRAYDPNALLILNFSFLSPDVNQMLEHYGQHMDGDIISYDAYTWTNSSYQHLADFRRSALKYNKPYWRYLFSHYSSSEDVISESDLRWEAFIGLVYGYTGHTWFIYQIDQNDVLAPMFFERQNDFNSPKTDLWAYAAQINRELANLGKSITQMTSTDVRYVPFSTYYIPPGTVPWTKGAGNDPYITGIAHAPNDDSLEILIGHFRDDSGEFYTMVQNVRHTHGDFPVNRSDPGTVRISVDFSKAPLNFDKSRVLALNKINGQIESVPLTYQDGNTGYLDVRLAAGDPFLFKYATGDPFALK
ncbi:MAG: hypothetical protein V1714_05310 [Pseudomonadota bacterium]